MISSFQLHSFQVPQNLNESIEKIRKNVSERDELYVTESIIDNSFDISDLSLEDFNVFFDALAEFSKI